MVTSSTEGGSRVRCWEKTLQEHFAIEKEANKVLGPFVLEWVQEEDCYNGLESNSPVIKGPAEYPEISDPSAPSAKLQHQLLASVKSLLVVNPGCCTWHKQMGRDRWVLSDTKTRETWRRVGKNLQVWFKQWSNVSKQVPRYTWEAQGSVPDLKEDRKATERGRAASSYGWIFCSHTLKQAGSWFFFLPRPSWKKYD